MLALRYGGTEHVSRTRRPEDAIANGQFILVDRDAYERMDGHARVRDRVAEDLSMAQDWVRAGLRIALVRGERHFATRMYASLREIVAGWRKNIYAGGRLAMIGGGIGRALFPLALLAMPLSILIPLAVLVLGAVGVLSSAWLIWSAIVAAMWLVFWLIVYVGMQESPWYAVLYPLGAAMLLYIACGALARGQRVEWKSRAYLSS
jgi:chlorobactene glucosyltransferase